MKKNTLKTLRNKLDQLDNTFLNLIKKRTLIVDQVIKTKKFKKDIIDRKRINTILRNIKLKSKSRKLDYRITLSIWKSMIKAYIDYEYRNFKKK